MMSFRLLTCSLLLCCIANSHNICAQTITARSDSFIVHTTLQPVYADVLANDETSTCTDEQLCIEIEPLTLPQRGSIFYSLDDSGKPILFYLPNADFQQIDEFWYRITCFNPQTGSPNNNEYVSDSARAVFFLAEGQANSCTDDDCVFPGDANYDGIVNVWDLLCIGIGYQFQGEERQDTGILWQPYEATDWSLNIGNLNFKHSDCNGDGTINVNDVQAIANNYGNMHTFDTDTIEFIPQNSTFSPITITVDIQNDIINIGDTVIAHIILGSPQDAVSIYGIAFSISHNVVDSSAAPIQFLNSFIGDSTNTISYQRNLGNGLIEAAITRTNHTQSVGNGVFGRISFVMEDFIEGKDQTEDVQIYLNTAYIITGEQASSYSYVTNETAVTAISTIGDEASVVLNNNGATNPNNINTLQPYPNPTQSHFNLPFDDKNKIEKIEIYDNKGQKVMAKNVNSNQEVPIDVSNLKKGIYFAKITTNKKVEVHKIFITE